MTTFAQGLNTAFIIREEAGHLSRQNGVVKSGEVLKAGEVLALDGAELVAWTSGDAAGVLLYPVDASGGAKSGAYIARAAEVNANLLVYPDDAEEADVLVALAAIGIIVRLSAAFIGVGGGGEELPDLSEGFHYIVNAEGKYIVNADGAYILADGDI